MIYPFHIIDVSNFFAKEMKGYNMRVSLWAFGLVLLEFVDDEVHGVEDVALELVVGVVVEVPAAVLGDALPDQRLHCLLLQPQRLVQLLVVALLVVRTHLLLLDVPLDVLALQLVDDLLPLEPLFVLRHLLRLDDVVDQLS